MPTQEEIESKYKELIKDINLVSHGERLYRNSLLKALQSGCGHPNIRPSPQPLHYRAYCPDCGFLDTDEYYAWT